MQIGFLKDARYFQIFSQLIFLGYGMAFLHWNAEWGLYVTYFLVSIGTQAVCEVAFNNNQRKIIFLTWWKKFKAGIPSASITALGLSLLLKTNHYWIAAFAAFVSIISKYLVRVNGKHIFNPSALGIVAAIILSGGAWISVGQWGSDIVLFFAILCLGFIIVTRVQKLDLSLAFLGTYASLIFARQVLFLNWPIDYFIQSISTGSLLLFSFFMISDPRTAPNHPFARIIWAILVAAVAFYLNVFQFVNAAPVWVLVFSQPAVPLLDKIFKDKIFKWKEGNQIAIAGTKQPSPAIN